MSGGHFDYEDFRLQGIAETLRTDIARIRTKQEWFDSYSDKFVAELERALGVTIEAMIRLHRIDWCLSGDDDEETYYERLEEDLAEMMDEYDVDDEKWLHRYDDDD